MQLISLCIVLEFCKQKRKGVQGIIDIENPNLVKQKNLKAKDADVSLQNFTSVSLFCYVILWKVKFSIVVQLTKTSELSRRERYSFHLLIGTSLLLLAQYTAACVCVCVMQMQNDINFRRMKNLILMFWRKNKFSNELWNLEFEYI